jgi:hypothetical protein
LKGNVCVDKKLPWTSDIREEIDCCVETFEGIKKCLTRKFETLKKLNECHPTSPMLLILLLLVLVFVNLISIGVFIMYEKQKQTQLNADNIELLAEQDNTF